MRRGASFAAVLSLACAADARGNPESVALRARASIQIYNLDRDQAIETFRQSIAADSQDAAAYRGLAAGLWLSITFRRGNRPVDDYLGRVTKPIGPSSAAPSESARSEERRVGKECSCGWAAVRCEGGRR